MFYFIVLREWDKTIQHEVIMFSAVNAHIRFRVTVKDAEDECKTLLKSGPSFVPREQIPPEHVKISASLSLKMSPTCCFTPV